METTMVNNLISTLEKIKGESTSLWVHGVFSLPVVTLEDFDWWFQETNDGEEFLILNGGEDCIPIMVSEIFQICTDEFTNEIVIYFNNTMLMQIWCDI